MGRIVTQEAQCQNRERTGALQAGSPLGVVDATGTFSYCHLTFFILPFVGPAAASIKLTTQTMSAMTRKRIILIRKRPSSRMYTRGKPGNGPSLDEN